MSHQNTFIVPQSTIRQLQEGINRPPISIEEWINRSAGQHSRAISKSFAVLKRELALAQYYATHPKFNTHADGVDPR